MWKESCVIPFLKNGNLNKFRQLEPTSMLIFLSKIYEKLIYSQMSQFLEVNNLLTEVQSVIRKDFGCDTV